MNNMKDLYEKVAGDIDLQNKFSEIMKNNDKGKLEETRKNLQDFAKEAGYTGTFEEVEKFFSDLLEQQKGELSESELDVVAGGKNSDIIKHSITSLGSYCAALSAATAIKGDDCGGKF